MIINQKQFSTTDLSTFNSTDIPDDYDNRYNIEYILNHFFTVAQKEEMITVTLPGLIGIKKRMFQRYLKVGMDSNIDNMKYEYLVILKQYWGLDSVEDLMNPALKKKLS